MKEKLLGKNLDELKAAVTVLGLKPFVGRQLAEWLYSKRATGWDQMTNISKDAKARLSEAYDLGTAAPAGIAESSDGTKKYLFPVTCRVAGGDEESFIEAVMIPDEDRKTLCVSSQAGCKMGCRFCMTGRQGWHGNLSAADILNQFLSVDESKELTNTVFMGMGEPLDNYPAVSRAIEVLTADWGFGWSPKRITVSTIGVIPVLKRYLDEQRCHLAVSLHNPFGEERGQMMPVQKAWPLDRLLKGLECRVNLIRFHKIPDFPFDTASQQAMEAFRDRLNNNGTVCTIRSSRGEDILAACGMLAGKHSQQR